MNYWNTAKNDGRLITYRNFKVDSDFCITFIYIYNIFNSDLYRGIPVYVKKRVVLDWYM